MKVTFTKVDDKRYTVAIARDHGPALVPRFAPGFDDLITPAPEDRSEQLRRRGARIGAIGREDMARSEQLVVITVAAWERSIDRVKHQVRQFPIDVDAASLHGAVRRMDEVARRWKALRHGGSLTFIWPRRLTFDASKSRRGRRDARSKPSLARR